MDQSINQPAASSATADEQLYRQCQLAVAADTRRQIDDAVDAIARNQDFAPVTSGVTDVGFLKSLTKDLRNALKAHTPVSWYDQKISYFEKLTEEQYPIYRDARLAALDSKLGRSLVDGVDLTNEMTGRDMAASFLLAAAGLYLSTYLTTLIGQVDAPRTAAREKLFDLEVDLRAAMSQYLHHGGATASYVATALAGGKGTVNVLEKNTIQTLKTESESARSPRQTWREVAMPYILATYKSGQYKTAKNLYKALESKTQDPDSGSPFEKGTGTNHGSLFVREIGGTLALKTLENAWSEIRMAART